MCGPMSRPEENYRNIDEFTNCPQCKKSLKQEDLEEHLKSCKKNKNK